MAKDIIPTFGRGGLNGEKRGGPPKISQQVHDDFMEAARLGMPIDKCCDVAGINPQTFYNWECLAAEYEAADESKRKKMPKWAYAAAVFVSNAKIARSKGQLKRLQKMESIANGEIKGNWLPHAWMLERLDQPTFALRNQGQAPTTVVVNVKEALDAAEAALQIPAQPPVEDQPALPAEVIVEDETPG